MRVDEALKENGKAHRVGGTAAYLMLDEFGVPGYYSKADDSVWSNKPTLESLLGDNWQPYPEEKEIRPEKAWEIWLNDKGGSFYTNLGYGDRLRLTYYNGVVEDLLDDEGLVNDRGIIHNQGGWKRVEPPVPDESVERIEVMPEMYSGKENGDFDYLIQLPHGYYEKVDGRKCILEFPKA